MLKFAIPVLHVSNSSEAEKFYCGRLGFKKEFANRPDEKKAEPCYMGISRDGIWLHLSSFSGDGVAGGVANIYVDDVDKLFAEFIAKGVKIDLKPTDQSWGTREMYVKDADGNCLRFVQEGKRG